MNSSTLPKIGDAVTISVPANHEDEICIRYNGQTGTIVGSSREVADSEEMFSVRFADGYRDGFYADEFTVNLSR